MKKLMKKIKYLMYKLKLGGLVQFMRDIGLVYRLHILSEIFGSHKFRKFYKENSSKFKEVYKLLEDDLSKETYSAVINYRCYGRKKKLLACMVHQQYFIKEIFGDFIGDVFVDGGAYRGETVQELVEMGGYIIEFVCGNRTRSIYNILKII